MERKHKQLIQQKYPHLFYDLTIIVLDIPDKYQYLNQELIDELTHKVNQYLTQT